MHDQTKRAQPREHSAHGGRHAGAARAGHARADDRDPRRDRRGTGWKVVWSWQGNNADGPIAGDNGTLLFANNDASNVMQFDPATGLATDRLRRHRIPAAPCRAARTARCLSRRADSDAGIEQLEPQRKMLANTFNGEPLECVGGVLNDLTADARGGVYFSVYRRRGVFYASPKGVVSQYGKDVPAPTASSSAPTRRRCT